MRALRLIIVSSAIAVTLPSVALADIATTEETDTSGEKDEDDDKGCATAAAPVSALSLALGVGLVLLPRRRND